MTKGVGPGPAPPRRVVILSESGGLAVLLGHLLGGDGRLHRFASLAEALEHDGLLDADAVLLDLPSEGAETAVAHVRHHWKGELVVLADRGRPRPDAPLEPPWTFLTRPFSVRDLATALGLPTMAPTGPAADLDPAAETGPATETGPQAGAGPGIGPAAEVAAAWAAARQAAARPVAGGAAAIKGVGRLAPAWVQAAADRVGAARLADWALGALADFAEAWRERRRVRVAGFSVLALLAFTIAFALAAQDRCGAACGAFGTGFAPLPTVAPGGPGGPATTAPRRAPASTAATGGSSGTGAWGGRVATTTTVARATTTTRGSGGGGPGPTTRPTRPPTTPTTEPPTTPTTQGTPTTTTIGLPGLPLP